MSAHTPGPWRVLPCNSRVEEIVTNRSLANGRVELVRVAEVRLINAGQANARLIAAAPLMLEALKALEWSGVDAIEAVTFRSCPSCGAPEFALDDEPREHGQHMQDCKLGAAIAAAEGRS